MNTRVDYQKELNRVIAGIEKSGKKPSLLLHCCCAPCSSYVLSYLADFFDITAFYYNPNIFPNTEYELRKKELELLIFRMFTPGTVNLIAEKYSPGDFANPAWPLRYEEEGGTRCHMCYTVRLGRTAQVATSIGAEYFCTTLTVSPYKNAQKLNEIGNALSGTCGVKYLPSDFKKQDGYKKSIELSKKYNLYRQKYCGCTPPDSAFFGNLQAF